MNRIFNITLRKVGGIRFLRIGRFQFSFCICRKVPKTFEWADELPPMRIYYGGNTMAVIRDE